MDSHLYAMTVRHKEVPRVTLKMVGMESGRRIDVLLGALWIAKDILGEVIAEERERTPILPRWVQ